MGMAASQARLLTLTARIHDVEYEAQALQNAKVQLSTQSDYVYQEYLEALDATTMTINTENDTKISATFNNLCSLDRVNTSNGKTYALHDSRGRLIVTDDVYNMYNDFIESSESMSSDYRNDICFAMYAMGIDISSKDASVYDAEKEIYEKKAATASEDSTLVKAYKNVQDVIKDIDNKYDNFTMIPDSNGEPDIYANNNIETNSEISSEDKKLYENALYAFRTQLYKEEGSAIYDSDKAVTRDSDSKDDFDYGTFQYYASLFNQIRQSGGCVAISEFDKEDENSNAANNSEWLKSMVERGEITISVVKSNAKAGEALFETTSPSSDTAISYTQTTDIDKTALAKAEAKYEHDTKEINKKDEKFDLELSKLESERTALTTEYDSVKKVIEDNIERTFGIFS